MIIMINGFPFRQINEKKNDDVFKNVINVNLCFTNKIQLYESIKF